MSPAKDTTSNSAQGDWGRPVSYVHPTSTASPAKVETDAIRARMVRKAAGFGVYSSMGLVEGTEILLQRQEQKAKRIGSLLRQR